MRELSSIIVSVFVLGMLGSTTVAKASVPDRAIEVGKPFPDIALPTLEGQRGTTLAVSRFRGTKVVLHVFASW